MTSDQGTSGGAELQLGNTLVTPKSHGLNPNANIFQSKTPSAATAEPSQWEGEDTPTTSMDTDGYSYMNGDINKTMPGADVSGAAVATTSQTMKTEDYEAMNGAVESSDPVLSDAGSPSTAPPVTTVTLSADMVSNTSDFTSASSSPPPATQSTSSTTLPQSPLSPDISLDGTVPTDQLRTMLKEQLEYYFSRDNLASDSYLVSQMDADQYVPIATIASFNLVKRLTANLELIIEVLRESSNVQVDEKGEKVRPLHKRCIVILREIPDTTPLEEVKALFSGANCPRFVSCEFAHNNSWYVTFDSDEDAQRAYRYLREEIQIFLGKPIMARIKAKPLLRSTFMPKNGFKPQYNVNQYSQSQTTFSTATTYTPPIQYINSQPQQGPARLDHSSMGPSPLQNPPRQSFPFYPSPNTVLSPWTPTSPPYFDPGMVFAVNGYQPQGTFKLNTAPGRHGYQNIRNSSANFRNQNKPHNRNQNNVMERSSIQDGRPSSYERERHSSVGMHRSSPRSQEMMQQEMSPGPRSKSLSSHSSYHSAPVSQSHTPPATESNPQTMSSRHTEVIVRDQALQQKSAFKSRRRREDEGAKNSRQSSSQPPNKDVGKPAIGSPKFELESTSFPPLPGSTNSTTTGDIFENKMSDVVKGTAKPLTRETKPTLSQSPQKEMSVALSVTTSSPTNSTATVTSPPLSPKRIEKSSSAPPESIGNTTTSSSCSKPETPTPVSSEKVTPTPTTSSPTNATSPTSMTTTASQPTKAPQQHSQNTSHPTVKEPPVKSTQKHQQKQQQQQQLPSTPLDTEEKMSSSGVPARLTYAQMLARGASARALEAAEKALEEAKDSSEAKPQALKEQSQISKAQSASVKAPIKGDDPKEQRVVGRRAKENRGERRERDRRRPRSPMK